MNELPASEAEKKVNVFRSRRKSYQFILKVQFHNLIPKTVNASLKVLNFMRLLFMFYEGVKMCLYIFQFDQIIVL